MTWLPTRSIFDTAKWVHSEILARIFRYSHQFGEENLLLLLYLRQMVAIQYERNDKKYVVIKTVAPTFEEHFFIKMSWRCCTSVRGGQGESMEVVRKWRDIYRSKCVTAARKGEGFGSSSLVQKQKKKFSVTQ